ncbi:phage baseplate assembly protein W [Bradyrhizobium sp. AZCC 1610]|uniref:GPW/gp25 family protein n=1 Tax=Bradyrhizobium sp. AZCC 1610 TaxID=3117020 RepID=UPI002FF16080
MPTAPTEHLIDIDRFTGELIQGWARIKQSIYVILTTRLRTRLMRLWWGSKFIDMQDKPGNEEVLMAGMMAAIVAINTYEPEFKVTKVIIDEFGPDGDITITIEGVDLVDYAQKRFRQTI